MIVGTRVSKFLGKNGLDLSTIVDVIATLLRSPEPSPPTSEAIWEQFGNESKIDLKDFKRLINLLGECKLLWMSQKRIYLPNIKAE
jgi:hypothetical protein